MSLTPHPGSPEAQKQGCTCPVLDNNYGRPGGFDGAGTFWVVEDCPIHNAASDKASGERDE